MADEKIYPLAHAVREAYRTGEDDETMEPLVLVDDEKRPVGRIQEGDYVVFYDIRGEREIELTEAFIAESFPHFPRRSMHTHWATMIEYHPDLDVRVAFPPLGEVPDTLSETVSKAGMRQIKIVESEKSVHLGYFLNGKRTEPYDGEVQRVIPSKEFEGYLPSPEMRADVVTDAVIEALEDESFDLVIVNWANVDVIGHSEDRDAIKRAVSTVDAQLGRALEVAKAQKVAALVTADHGTVEKWYYADGSIDTGHTDSLVPLILVAPHLEGVSLRNDGTLTDVAPTVLALLGISKPQSMTGSSMLSLCPEKPSRVALFILDGWGDRDDEWGNLILEAHTPIMDQLKRTCPNTRIEAAGRAVGLPNTVPGRDGKTVGNSEVGHLHLGAGRILPSDRLRIEQAIKDGSFFQNSAFRWAMEGTKRDGSQLHLLGIISFYSSHGSVEHLKALLLMAKQMGVPEVYVHGMLGRRGEKPESGALYVQDIEIECEKLGVGQFASLIGRFWSLDREYNWDRIEKSYRWLVYGEGRPVSSLFSGTPYQQ